MPRKPSRSSLRNKADRLFSKIVRSRGHCQAEPWEDGVECGGDLQCAHIVGRANYRLRWVFDNALSLCAGHHVWYTNHPIEWYRAVDAFDPGRLDRLATLGREMWDRDYEGLLARLTEEAELRGVTA